MKEPKLQLRLAKSTLTCRTNKNTDPDLQSTYHVEGGLDAEGREEQVSSIPFASYEKC